MKGMNLKPGVKPLFEHQTKDYLSLQQNTSTHGENISLFLNDQRQ